MQHQQHWYAGDSGAATTERAGRTARGLSSHAANIRGSFRLRVAVAASRAQLDRDLADGVSPAHTPRHALRAQQLTGRSTRARLAALLRNLTELTARPPTRSRIEPSRRALGRCAPQIEALAARLSGHGAVYASGLAQLQRLFRDGTGALYSDRRGDDLVAAFAAIDAALSGSSPPDRDV